MGHKENPPQILDSRPPTLNSRTRGILTIIATEKLLFSEIEQYSGVNPPLKAILCNCFGYIIRLLGDALSTQCL